ncbi:uncharacterized protein LOC128634940 [Ictalurus punctatus]|uniref:Uncharacterized protein LOC128634940 n=1 Tax=Ictalurus punctatus TaxID=7998 RepID=A0A9F7TQV1_ICTPU|nr:uncharacterized protein LOC128634940 [Ictalurus punctatus]
MKCCSLSADNPTKITGHTGGSVLFPCSCSDLHTKPQRFTWRSDRTGRLKEMLNDEHYRGRLQLFNHISPANLSLLISDLREEDQGLYSCRTEKEYRDIWLNVKGRRETSTRSRTNTTLPSEPPQSKTTNSPPASSSTTLEQDKQQTHSSLPPGRRETSTHSRKTDTTRPSEPPQSKTTNSPPASSSTTLEQDKQQTHRSLLLVFGILAVLLLVIPGVVAFICWRRKGGRCGEKVITEGRPDCKRKRKDQTEPGVTYSTVTHMNTAGAARVQINAGDKTEYASILTI